MPNRSVRSRLVVSGLQLQTLPDVTDSLSEAGFFSEVVAQKIDDGTPSGRFVYWTRHAAVVAATAGGIALCLCVGEEIPVGAVSRMGQGIHCHIMACLAEGIEQQLALVMGDQWILAAVQQHDGWFRFVDPGDGVGLGDLVGAALDGTARGIPGAAS